MKRFRDIPKEKRSDVLDIFTKLGDSGVFLLKGELEHYYREQGKALIAGISGKEEKPIVLVSIVAEGKARIVDLVNCCEYWKIFNFVEKHFKKTG